MHKGIKQFLHFLLIGTICSTVYYLSLDIIFNVHPIKIIHRIPVFIFGFYLAGLFFNEKITLSFICKWYDMWIGLFWDSKKKWLYILPFPCIGFILKFNLTPISTGTKSVLFGVHCFLLHPWFVAYAWWKLYGFPIDPRLWIAFFVHDLGYIGKHKMDDEEGEKHPYLGANIMLFFFGNEWRDFTLYHSRFLAKKHNRPYTKLCVADKLAICLTPAWLYLPMAKASGEIKEYMKDADKNTNGSVSVGITEKEWLAGVKDYVRKWVDEYKEIKEDVTTPLTRQPVNNKGV